MPPVGADDAAGVFCCGLRVVSMDGSTTDVPDTKENDAHFGRPCNASRDGAFPQVRWLAAAESGTGALLGTGSSTATRTASSTTTPAFTPATATSALTPSSTSTTTGSSGIRSRVVLTIESERVLGLGLLGAVLLATGTSEVLLVDTLDGLALGELLAGALVGLADGEAVAGKSLALLGEVGKVLFVGLGVVLLNLGGGVHAVGTSSGSRVGAVVVLNFGSGKVGTSLLVVPLGGTLLEAPAVTGLLLVLAFA